MLYFASHACYMFYDPVISNIATKYKYIGTFSAFISDFKVLHLLQSISFSYIYEPRETCLLCFIIPFNCNKNKIEFASSLKKFGHLTYEFSIEMLHIWWIILNDRKSHTLLNARRAREFA